MSSPLHWYEAVWNVNSSNAAKPATPPAAREQSPLFWLEEAWKLGPTADLQEEPSANSGRTLRNGLNRLISFFTVSSEPRIWQSSNGLGPIFKGQSAKQVLWNAYDPETGRSIYGVSETELRAWLEERYYQTRVGH